MKSMKLVGFCCALGLVSLFVAGCGGGVGSDFGAVSGTVTMDGAPLEGASVTFQPEMASGGSPSYGTTDANGKYELMFTFSKKGAMLGEHKVSISKTLGGGDDDDDDDGDDDDDDAEEEDLVPAKYNSETTLTATVESGSQVRDFPLTSGADAPAAE